MLRQQHGIAVRREKNSREAEKDLIGLERKCCLGVLIRGLENLESFQKDLIWFVRICCFGVLI